MNRKSEKAADSVDRKALNMRDFRSTPELAESYGYLLRRLQILFKKNFLRIANANIHTGEVGVMMMIGHHPGITPSEISAQLGMEAAQVAVVVGRLELQRLVKRPTSLSDGRSRPIRLSAQGERQFATVRRIAVEAEDSFIGDALNEEESQQLRDLLTKLLIANI